MRIAEKMTADYFECLKKLNVTGVDKFPKATEHIQGMIEIIETLVAKGHAYKGNAGVQFHVPSMPDYGKLSRQPRDAADSACGCCSSSHPWSGRVPAGTMFTATT